MLELRPSKATGGLSIPNCLPVVEAEALRAAEAESQRDTQPRYESLSSVPLASDSDDSREFASLNRNCSYSSRTHPCWRCGLPTMPSFVPLSVPRLNEVI